MLLPSSFRATLRNKFVHYAAASLAPGDQSWSVQGLTIDVPVSVK